LPLSELLEKAGDGVGLRASVTELPTARTMLPNDRWLCPFVWCKACHHQAPANLQAIIDRQER